MKNTVAIRGHDSLVQLEVQGYERSSSAHSDDKNWLTCRCMVKVKGISGDTTLSLMTHDLERFRSDLQCALASVSGGATFTTHEEGIELVINFRVTGAAEVRGIFRDAANSIAFSFDTDQTFLSQTESELQAVLRQFPVRN